MHSLSTLRLAIYTEPCGKKGKNRILSRLEVPNFLLFVQAIERKGNKTKNPICPYVMRGGGGKKGPWEWEATKALCSTQHWFRQSFLRGLLPCIHGEIKRRRRLYISSKNETKPRNVLNLLGSTEGMYRKFEQKILKNCLLLAG
jgi:hypothetical protein